MRAAPPEYFEVLVVRNDYQARTTIEVWSRAYDIRLGYTLRDTWGDPGPLVDFIETLIGGTVRSWFEARVGDGSGREMARALMPMWEREIHHHMERMEYENHRRPLRYRDEYNGFIEPRYLYGWDMAGPPEDPKAKQKARELLLRNLDAGQEKSFKKDGEFRVTAKDGKAYTIKTARSFNVVGPDGTKYCGQLRDTPVEDQMLAQKLLLEHEPDKFFKNANVSPAQQPTTDEVRYSMVNDPARWLLGNTFG
jgi:hypothetical protein